MKNEKQTESYIEPLIRKCSSIFEKIYPEINADVFDKNSFKSKIDLSFLEEAPGNTDDVRYIVNTYIPEILKSLRFPEHLEPTELFFSEKCEKEKYWVSTINDPFIFSLIFLTIVSVLAKNYCSKMLISSHLESNSFTLEAKVLMMQRFVEEKPLNGTTNKFYDLKEAEILFEQRAAFIVDEFIRLNNNLSLEVTGSDYKITVKLKTTDVDAPRGLSAADNSNVGTYNEFMNYLKSDIS